MKWIIVIFVNFLPVTGQWEMLDYRYDLFQSEASCLNYVKENKQFFINEANKAYRRNDKDYVIGCPTLDKFNDNVMPDEIAA